MKATPWIWKNGTCIKWEDATTHVLTHALHYGTGVFEGIRAYQTENGPAIFRGRDHFKRLANSAKIIEMKPPYSEEEMLNQTKELLRKNDLGACYIRPLFYFGYGELGLNPGRNPVDAIIAAWEWGTYLGEEGLKNGIRCKMSSWTRIDSRSIPPLSKSTANYLNSALAKREAVQCGFDEGILLNTNGTVAEGPGENIFLVKGKELFTPPASDSALHGITAQSVTVLAEQLGYSVSQRSIIRDELFTADELFFTGTAAEVTPIREINGRVIGSGSRGPVTEAIQARFFDTVSGKNTSLLDWLDIV